MSEVARIIFNQLGGNRFAAFTGCKDFISNSERESLTMSLPRNGSKANRLEIKYNYGTDSYTMRFYRHRNESFSTDRLLKTGNGWKEAKDTEIKEYKEIYADQLLDLFEETTKLYVPFRIVF